jgi:hypothetical protein
MLSRHCSDTLGISTPLQSRKDMVSIAPFNLNIVPAIQTQNKQSKFLEKANQT